MNRKNIVVLVLALVLLSSSLEASKPWGTSRRVFCGALISGAVGGGFLALRKVLSPPSAGDYLEKIGRSSMAGEPLLLDQAEAIKRVLTEKGTQLTFVFSPEIHTCKHCIANRRGRRAESETGNKPFVLEEGLLKAGKFNFEAVEGPTGIESALHLSMVYSLEALGDLYSLAFRKDTASFDRILNSTVGALISLKMSPLRTAYLKSIRKKTINNIERESQNPEDLKTAAASWIDFAEFILANPHFSIPAGIEKFKREKKPLKLGAVSPLIEALFEIQKETWKASDPEWSAPHMILFSKFAQVSSLTPVELASLSLTFNLGFREREMVRNSFDRTLPAAQNSKELNYIIGAAHAVRMARLVRESLHFSGLSGKFKIVLDMGYLEHEGSAIYQKDMPKAQAFAREFPGEVSLR